MEFFDVYNDKKEKTGEKLPRKGSFLKEGQYQLIVLALLERPDHKFLITRRAMNKKWAAGDWEVSGGGVQSGETSFEGVCREVREETGLDVSHAEGVLMRRTSACRSPRRSAFRSCRLRRSGSSRRQGSSCTTRGSSRHSTRRGMFPSCKPRMSEVQRATLFGR